MLSQLHTSSITSDIPQKKKLMTHLKELGEEENFINKN